MTDESEPTHYDVPYSENGIQDANGEFRAISNLLLAWCGESSQLSFEGDKSPKKCLVHFWSDENTGTHYALSKHQEKLDSEFGYEFHQLMVVPAGSKGESYVVHQLDDYNHSYGNITYSQAPEQEVGFEDYREGDKEPDLNEHFNVTDQKGKELKFRVVVNEIPPAVRIRILTELLNAEFSRVLEDS